MHKYYYIIGCEWKEYERHNQILPKVSQRKFLTYFNSGSNYVKQVQRPGAGPGVDNNVSKWDIIFHALCL